LWELFFRFFSIHPRGNGNPKWLQEYGAALQETGSPGFRREEGLVQHRVWSYCTDIYADLKHKSVMCFGVCKTDLYLSGAVTSPKKRFCRAICPGLNLCASSYVCMSVCSLHRQKCLPVQHSLPSTDSTRTQNDPRWNRSTLFRWSHCMVLSWTGSTRHCKVLSWTYTRSR